MKLKTAESVTSGHPDKLADYIADCILDECMAQDPESRVACEVLLSHEVLMIAGEITTKANVDYQAIAEKAIRNVGYEPPDSFVDDIFTQSPDIKQAVDESDTHEQGAGDQGIVYGYATNETLSQIPLAADLAHRLTDKLMEMHEGRNELKLGADGKAQVTVAYGEDDKFIRIASVLVSVQHSEDAEIKALRKGLLDLIIKPALGEFDISQTEIIINPSGRFVKGGFEADTGLTGRKLMVDTYGGLAHHGGGAMSGKDPSKVDRSGAYMARYIANAIIKAELASECEVSIAYAIGKAQPTAVNVDTFGTWAVAPSRYITEAVKRAFDLTPAGIIRQLRLKGTSYRYTAINGHFGCEKGYPWENVDSPTVTRLKNALNEVIESEEESR